MAVTKSGCVGGRALGMGAVVSQMVWIWLGVWCVEMAVMSSVVGWG